MSVQIDEATVRQFIELISEHVKEAINGAGQPGFLQLCRINPLDDKSVVPSRFKLSCNCMRMKAVRSGLDMRPN